MKRSKALRLVLMGAAPLLVAGCNDKPVVGYLYRTAQECQEAAIFSAAQCQQEYGQAAARHEQQAPRYRLRTDCEADFGVGSCAPVGQAIAAYVPPLAGYLIGLAVVEAQGSQGQPLRWFEQRFPSQPLYRALRDDHWRSGCNEYVGARAGRIAVLEAVTRSRSAPQATRGGFGAKAATLCSQGG